MRRIRVHVAWLTVAIGLVALDSPASAGDPTLEAKMHLRVLTYDRNMAKRGPAEGVTIGVVYDSESADSEADARARGAAFVKAAAAAKLNNRTISVVLVPWTVAAMLDQVRDGRLVALYLAAGTWSQLDDIKRVAAELKTPTMASSRAMVAAGVGIGVIPSGDSVKILINRKAATANGMRLDARVYKHSELIDSK